ncbi:M15 family peptidase [Erwinia psidii]|uniref:M15 family metallopeptidase n=1 Tax=Erwinia psidii TaxID=69224 RepID=UPI00226B728B|nr:M15 family metallopeptidase [Erwinia psidii]MCX8962154.1 M15 family peptidase [Erwinia psidii]
MSFKFSQRSERNLQGVHPDLVRIVRLAITRTCVDFAVIEGLRTPERQRELKATGKSQTLNSRHLTGHAVDLAPLINGVIPWNDQKPFKQIAAVMFDIAGELGIRIRWGGDWNMNGRSDDERFFDGPHFELLRADYPA